MISWFQEKIEKPKFARHSPLQPIMDKSITGKSDINLVWGYEIPLILDSLKTAADFPQSYQVVFLDLPYHNDSNIHLEPRLSSKTSIEANFAKKIEVYLSTKLFFEGSHEKYFILLKTVIEKSKDLLKNDGWFIVKYIGRFRHYLKVLIDEIFGLESFVNEVFISSPFSMKKKDECLGFTPKEVTGSLLIYSLNPKPFIAPVFKDKLSGGYWHTMHSKGQGPARIFRINGEEHIIEPPVGNHWKYKQDKIDEMCANGKIKLNTEGKPVYWVEPKKGHILDNNWLDVESHIRGPLGWECDRIIYDRIVSSFSKEGDTVLHIFSGSGIGANSVTELNRKYTGIDTRILAVSLNKSYFFSKNLLFNCYAAGIYQSNLMQEQFGMDYKDFILTLIDGHEVSNFVMFQGVSGKKLVHIAPVDYTISSNELEQCFLEFYEVRSIFDSFMIIAWDFLIDQKWKQIEKEIKEKKIKFSFITVKSLFKQRNISGRFLDSSIAEISVENMEESMKITIEDFFFLNSGLIDESVRKEIDDQKTFSDRISHWTVTMFDDEKNIIGHNVIYRSNKENLLSLSYEIPKNNHCRLVRIGIFDICGAVCLIEKNLMRDK